MRDTASRRVDTERLLTLPEVADVLGVPLQTLYQWRTRSEGPRGIRVGRHVRVRRSDLESWLEEHADRERTGMSRKKNPGADGLGADTERAGSGIDVSRVRAGVDRSSSRRPPHGAPCDACGAARSGATP